MFDAPTPNLALPYIMPAQAQKHVTHNEAIRSLDALVQLAVKQRTQLAPPATPADGDRYIVPAAATGVWAGHATKIAAWQDGAWSLYTPLEGWLAWVANENIAVVFDGAAWVTAIDPSASATGAIAAHIAAADPHPAYLLATEAADALAGQSAQNLAKLGINATADTINRLALASPASLFNHAGNGHQIKLNKAASTDTATLLFQTAFSGRAEFGLAGDDNVRLKVSPDGTTFADALVIDTATANFGIGATPASGIKLDIGQGAARAGSAQLDKPAGTAVDLTFQRAAQPRWVLSMTNTAESGTATGSDLQLTRYNNAGALLGTPLRLTRSNGDIVAAANVRGYHVRPNVDNTYELGSSTLRWTQMWAVNGTIQTSDVRDKTDIAALSPRTAAALVDAVDPVTYRWRTTTDPSADPVSDDSKPRTRPGKRRHAGFLAQDVKRALDRQNLDCAVWGNLDADDDDSRQWLRPDQLVPILWAALRQTRADLALLRH